MLWLAIEFVFFVASTGVLFQERFRKNRIAIAAAATIAIVSTYFLAETLFDRLAPPGGQAQVNSEDMFWLSIKDSAVPALFDEFVNAFPKSRHAAEARARSAQLKESRKNAAEQAPGGASLETKLGGNETSFKPNKVVRETSRVHDADSKEQIAEKSVGLENAVPPNEQPPGELGLRNHLEEEFRRQMVDYRSIVQPGTIVIDTANRYLYLVLGDQKALRYGIGVSPRCVKMRGQRVVTRLLEWPDWHPSSSLRAANPGLPSFMAGGPGNPLGARAIYFGNRSDNIHGTTWPQTIGTVVDDQSQGDAGCFVLINEDVEDLYSRIQPGTKLLISG